MIITIKLLLGTMLHILAIGQILTHLGCTLKMESRLLLMIILTLVDHLSKVYAVKLLTLQIVSKFKLPPLHIMLLIYHSIFQLWPPKLTPLFNLGELRNSSLEPNSVTQNVLLASEALTVIAYLVHQDSTFREMFVWMHVIPTTIR